MKNIMLFMLMLLTGCSSKFLEDCAITDCKVTYTPAEKYRILDPFDNIKVSNRKPY